MRSKYKFEFDKIFPKCFWFKFESDIDANHSLQHRANEEFKHWNKKHKIPKALFKEKFPGGIYDKYKYV